MDCDMIALADISELFDLMDFSKSVMVCKHDYVPAEEKKFLGNIQTKYEKKNWSSVMLFNNEKCKALTPDYVNRATGLELHQFKWLESDEQIGSLPLDWNWLVGEYEKKDTAKIVHYTLGGPYFEKYSNCDYSEIWYDIKGRANSSTKE
jgi:lipopolysaccharide biosynthesis glycosyltransferase